MFGNCCFENAMKKLLRENVLSNRIDYLTVTFSVILDSELRFSPIFSRGSLLNVLDGTFLSLIYFIFNYVLMNLDILCNYRQIKVSTAIYFILF